MRKYFGTDGIRGSVGEGFITPDFVMKLGWAAGRVLAKTGSGPVLIGKDTRISGYMFESALEAGLSAAGVDIRLLGPMPTPGIAFLTRSTRARGGIVISASHNPYYDNGIKFFAADGTKLPDEVELEIEREMEQPMQTVYSRHLGKALRINDAARRYIEFCKSRIQPSLDLKGMKLVVDCAHGAAYNIAPSVFEELGAEVISIGAEPDGLNINEECGATKPEMLRDSVLENQADAGIALDGDGDRLIMIDRRGNVVDGDEALFIIARARRDRINGGVVGTQMSNFGLELAIRELGLDFHRSKVGDRYVMEMLQEKNLKLGGESSGHIINLDLATTGDGIISALQILEEMSRSGRSLYDLKQPMSKYPQRLNNIRLENRVDLGGHPEIDVLVREAMAALAGRGRVLLRPSGTEPLIRVMVEGENLEQVEDLALRLTHGVEQILRNQR
ncbi:MAG: phosphoglucosamine mutase [Gammaproteobacteria bacterium]|jgi:phosphoglucosamine mutase|nr:MAG: phosphoglucosamine mutase [Gammaproteobacteria bacterium]